MHAPLLGKPFGENEIIDFVLNLVGTVDNAVKNNVSPPDRV